MDTDMSEEMKTPESNDFDLEKHTAEIAEKAIAKYAMKQAEEKAAKEKAEAEAVEKQAEADAEAKAAQEAKQEEQKTIVQAGLSGAERLMEDVEKRVNDNYDNLESVVKNLESQLAEKSQEIEIPPSLMMVLPQDYVNYVKLVWSDSTGIEHVI